MLMPTVHICPPGHYAISFYMAPTDFRPGAQNMDNNWIGTVNMTCSDGSIFSIDTIPGHRSRLADGSSTSIDGEQQAEGCKPFTQHTDTSSATWKRATL
jgi:hypothetical protein